MTHRPTFVIGICVMRPKNAAVATVLYTFTMSCVSFHFISFTEAGRRLMYFGTIYFRVAPIISDCLAVFLACVCACLRAYVPACVTCLQYTIMIFDPC